MTTSHFASFFHEGQQRYQAAMAGVPDRVPVFAQLHEFASKQLKVSPKKFYTTPELLVRGTLEVTAAYGIDVAVLDYDVYNIEAEALGQEIIYSDKFMPDVNRTRPLIREKSDLKKIRTPNFERDGRFPAILKMHRLFQELTSGLAATPGFCAPFSLAVNLRGFEQLLMDMYTDPEFAKSLFTRISDDVLVPWIQRLHQACPDVESIGGSDAWTSLPILSPGIIRDWGVPYLKRIQKQCRVNVYVPNWIGEAFLKNPEEMLDLKMQVCPGFVEGQDPDVEKLGPSFYKTYAQKKDRPLVLGIGAAFLAQARPQQIRDRVREYIQVGGVGGGLALYLCSLNSATPQENVRAAIQAVRDFGTY